MLLQDLLRAWLFWRPHQPYGSIVFNNGGSLTITSNICTSRGAVSGVSTESELQSQVHKPDIAGYPHERATVISEAPLPLNSNAPVENSATSQAGALSCPAVHFETPPKTRDAQSVPKYTEQIQASTTRPE
jgi:hypothetical protein